MTKTRVGIIGCGAIGSSLARLISENFKDAAEVLYVCDHHKEKAKAVKSFLSRKAQVLSMPEVIRKSDFIVEAASTTFAEEILKSALKHGKQVMLMSVGGLLGIKNWKEITSQSHGRVWIPSGALAGVDALLGYKQGRIQSVTLKTFKPWKALVSAPYFQKRQFPKMSSNRPVCIFKGNAGQAVQGFPQNVNVAAILSLAGLGAEKTRVEIWTSKTQKVNSHEVEIKGDAGRVYAKVDNVPSVQNPKTSQLAVYSAAALLEKIFATIRLGT